MTRRNAADRFYSRWAPLYDQLAHHTPGIAGLRRRTVRRMALAPGMRILDMGCGPGPNFAPIRTAIGNRGELVGIDVAGGALTRAQARIQRSEWENVHVVRADATTPPIPASDAVIAAFVIGMFEHPDRVVDVWCDHVGSGGTIGLLHFAQSDRPYAVLPNALLRCLVFLSTPGRGDMHGNATDVLHRRVRAGYSSLEQRCSAYSYTTHWGGLVHIATGTVD